MSDITVPKISVIIPVYKAEKYIHKCIDSLLKQTFTDYEIILINDGSPDSSGKICDEYAKLDKRIRAFHKENGGVSSARQCGIDNARGEYTIHVDPDDWVESQMLDELYIKAKKDNVDMLICDFYEHDLNGERYIVQKPTRLICDSVLCDMFLFLHGSTWNKLIKRDCIIENNVKFDLDLSFCEDLYFNANLLLCNIKVSYLNKAFYHYERTENQNSIANPQNKTIIDFIEKIKTKRSKKENI
jgi:glycosyltransferase involved in cell wall biosynthesis